MEEGRKVMETKTELFHTVLQGGTGEIIVKKSRFIATVKPVDTEEEALEFIESLKKKYWDAAHNCYAYVIGIKNPLMRCSDDGEPSKTAGKPMLDILLSHELTNLVVVVTRYFGGTLLGTGGLVKAYQAAALEGLKQSLIIKKELGLRIKLITDYNLVGKIQYYIGQEDLPILTSEYSDVVMLEILVPVGKISAFEKKITELSNGSLHPETIEQVYFAIVNKEVHLFQVH
jgi:uncharacterized YigZ family protein